MTDETGSLRAGVDATRQTFNENVPSRSLREVLWALVSGTLFRWVPNRFIGWRRWILRRFGARIDGTAFVDRSVVIRFPWNLVIGPATVIHHNVVLDCMGAVSLGCGSRNSQYSHLCTRTHDYRDQKMQVLSKPIVVDDFVWVAADAYVGPGVTIGSRTIVGARSSVLRNLPPDVTAVGEPARPIRSRRSEAMGEGRSD